MERLVTKTGTLKTQSLRAKSSLFLIPVFMIAIVGCTDSKDDNPNDNVGSDVIVKSSSMVSTKVVTNSSSCPSGKAEQLEIGIDLNGNGSLDGAVGGKEINRIAEICHGVNGQAGLDGSISLVLVEDESGGANCANGGVKLSSGVDSNNDAELALEEIDYSKYLCNGTDGQNDANGFTSLTASIVEKAGDECVNGGLKIQTGLDSSRNQILDENEVKQVEYVCNGIHGLDGLDGLSNLVVASIEPAGENCTHGGAKVNSGLDDDFNGVLDNTEIDQSEYVCHGAPGQQGETGSKGETGEQGLSGSDGINGVNSLIVTINEPAGVMCPQGGLRVQTGLDSDNNGLLVDEEIANDTYICHGQNSNAAPCSLVDGVNGGKLLQCGNDNLFIELPPIYVDPEITTIANGYQIIDNWESSGGKNAFDPRNPNYVFDVTERATVEITIAAGGGNSGRFQLYDSSRILLTTSSNGNSYGSFQLEAGTYTLVAGSNFSRAKGAFDIDLLGPVSNIKKVSSTSIVHPAEWSTSAGRNSSSYLNPHFEFTVDRLSDFSFELSSNVDEQVYLIDESGLVTTFGTRHNEGTILLSPGRYTLVTGTYSVETEQSFNVRLTGQISDVSVDEATSQPIKGSWNVSGGRSFTSPANPAYEVTITEESELSLLLDSPVGRYLAILDDIGAPVKTGYTSTEGMVSLYLGAVLQPGIYTIVVGSYQTGVTSDFNLTVVGKFEENSVVQITR
jgi:hypothetical protein